MATLSESNAKCVRNLLTQLGGQPSGNLESDVRAVISRKGGYDTRKWRQLCGMNSLTPEMLDNFVKPPEDGKFHPNGTGRNGAEKKRRHGRGRIHAGGVAR